MARNRRPARFALNLLHAALIALFSLGSGTGGESSAAEAERATSSSQARRSAALRYRKSPRDFVGYGRTSRIGMTRGTGLLCSRIVFPWWFADRVRRLRADPRTHSLLFTHAARYFSDRLMIDIQPDRLRSRLVPKVTDGRHHLRLDRRFLDAADWGDVIRPMSNSPAWRETGELVEYRGRFREMPSYRAAIMAAAEGRPFSHNRLLLDSTDVIDAYFNHYLGLVENIEAHGLLRRADLPGKLRSPPGPSAIRLELAERDERDIGVAVAHDGTLICFAGGRHRTAIAQALRIPSMPVEVRLVHVGWLAEIMSRSGLPAHKALLSGLARLAGKVTAA